MKKTFVIALLLGGTMFAQDRTRVDIDFSSLTNEQKAQLVQQAEQMKKQNKDSNGEAFLKTVKDPEKLNEWVSLGKNVGLAMAAVAKELGVASDKFLESNTGKITAALIIWKVMGRDILHVVVGSVSWIVLASIIIWSFRFFHMTKPVKNKDGTIEYITRYEFNSNDARSGSAVAHAVAFAAVTIVCLIIIF